MQNPTSYILPILLIAFAIFMRIRRSIGFQQYRSIATVARIIVFVAILVIIFIFSVKYHPETIITNALGVVLGAGLSLLGIKYATFEKRKDDLYYRTHFWMEIGILTLFFFRLAYRFYILTDTLSNVPPEQVAGQLRYEKDPITGIIISMLCTYYIGYFTYIITKASKFKKADNI